MKKTKKITLLVDDAEVPYDDLQLNRQPKIPKAEFHVANALRELGHDVHVLCVDNSVSDIVDGINENKPDMVFNMTEQFRSQRILDANVAGLLEMMGVPFTGTGSVGLAISRRKGVSKRIMSCHRIRIPEFLTFPTGHPVRVSRHTRYPLVVKPAHEDGSDGISNSSLVKNRDALIDRVHLVHDKFKQPAIAEEYIEGRELYVSLLGNRRLQILPPREFFLGEKVNGHGPLLATSKVKWDKKYRKKWNITFGFAENIDKTLMDRISKVCRRVFRAMQLKDYARIDIRLTPDNKIVIIEANPNPDITYGDELAESAERAGISYNQLISRILDLAAKRQVS